MGDNWRFTKINFGDILSLLAALAYAFYNTIVDSQVRVQKINSLVNAFQQFVTVAIFSTILILFQRRSFGVGDFSSILSLSYLVLIPTLGVFTVMNITQKYLLPFTLSLILTLATVFGAVFAWTLGGEQVTTASLLGGILIVVAVCLTPIKKLLHFKLKKN
ncbi:DMT family transporter [Candidatus Gracilibacteria bacterium]|nr:DMT family transporter [Candidatus Gracilibacteria bacterium]